MTPPSAAGPRPGNAATLELLRADIGFSAAHFSVIDGEAERLHGHNYRVLLRAHGPVRDDGTVIDFHALKRALRDICAELDERTLVAAHSEALTVTTEEARVSVRVGARHYVFPSEDVVLLPVVNTTCECLATHLLQGLRARLGSTEVRLRLTVEEMPGQGASMEE